MIFFPIRLVQLRRRLPDRASNRSSPHHHRVREAARRSQRDLRRPAGHEVLGGRRRTVQRLRLRDLRRTFRAAQPRTNRLVSMTESHILNLILYL